MINFIEAANSPKLIIYIGKVYYFLIELCSIVFSLRYFREQERLPCTVDFTKIVVVQLRTKVAAFCFQENKDKVFYGQESPRGESTTTDCGVNYQLLAVMQLK